MNPLSDLERLVESIERQGANIAPTYQEYMPIAFAIANDCGEAGRSLFHRICRLSEKYASTDADRLYDHALKSGDGRNGLGTVFHLAEVAGVKAAPRGGTAPPGSLPKEAPETFKLSNFQQPLTHTHAHERALPRFPDYPWPSFLQQMIDCGSSPAQRDILLLGALTVLGATVNRRMRVLYGNKYQYPCLQTFVVAPPASGKGALTWVRQLAQPIHDEMIAAYRQRLSDYRAEKTRWDALGKQRADTPEPRQPPLKMFLIAGDNSGTGILENLIEAEGIGLICETEADTVSAAIDTEHGHWSDTLRKCHDHERLAFNRRGNHEYRECAASFLSVLLSGTPAQVRPLIPSSENGLFSRQLFYLMPPIEDWMDQFALDEDYNLRFNAWGRQWKRLLDALGRTVNLIQLRLSDSQKAIFNQHFARLFGHASLHRGGSMRSAVARIAINTCRLCSVVALLRATERALSPDRENAGELIPTDLPGLSPAEEIPAENIKDGIVPKLDLSVTDDDFHAVLALVEPLYRHSTHVLDLLPSSEVEMAKRSPEQAWLSALPLSFTRSQAIEEAAKRGVPKNTTDTHLRRMLDKGILIKSERGNYIFASRVCVREGRVKV